MSPDARCLDCGYLLRSLAEPRCPECGRGFSPDDCSSVNPGRPYGPWVKWALKPTYWIAPAAPWVSWGLFAIAAMLLVDHLFPIVVLSIVCIVFLFPYAVRGTLRNMVVRVYRQPREFRHADRASVRRIFIAFGIPFVLMFPESPLRIPFFLSLPWLNHVARSAYEGEPMLGPYPPPQWAGLYRITIANVTPRSVEARIGFVYLLWYPGFDHWLPGWKLDGMIPIGGGWYREIYYRDTRYDLVRCIVLIARRWL